MSDIDIDLAFLWVDLNDPWWKTATTEMLRSARRQMPNANIVQMSDYGARLHPFADMLFTASMECPPETLGDFRTVIMMEYLKQASRPVIYTGGDVIWCPLDKAVGEYRVTPYGAAVHFRGDRDGMLRFARSLDGGEPFKELAPGLDEIEVGYA
jgi:hypothetical protein